MAKQRILNKLCVVERITRLERALTHTHTDIHTHTHTTTATTKSKKKRINR